MTRRETYDAITHPTLPPEPAEVAGDPTQRESGEIKVRD
jgi:hypothetical protein